MSKETILYVGRVDVMGSSIPMQLTELVDNVLKLNGVIPAGVAGTAGAAGVMTLGSSHGFTDADVVMCTWATGRRYACTISAYDGTTVTLATGTGDELPTSGDVVVSKLLEIDAAVLGTNVNFIMLKSDVAATFTLEDAGGIELARNVAAGAAYIWAESSGDTNPITGDSITKCHVWNETAVAGSATGLIGYDND